MYPLKNQFRIIFGDDDDLAHESSTFEAIRKNYDITEFSLFRSDLNNVMMTIYRHLLGVKIENYSF